MLLSYYELHELIRAGIIDADPENVNGASIDLTLANQILIESYSLQKPVSLKDKQTPPMEAIEIGEEGFELRPSDFILASTNEIFHLPNDIAAEFKLKSSVARAGLNHCLAGFADPGWNNARLTLELKNELKYHTLLLKSGMKIGQMIFYRVNPVPEQHSYAIKGRYNNTIIVTESKGV